jgi:hypothetical protein
VQQLIAKRIASGDCSKSAQPSEAPSSSPTVGPRPPSAASTADASAPRTSETAHLAAVRLGQHDGNDRLVLEFTDSVPGYTIGYRPLPMRMDASGADIPLPGANAAVHISLTSATASGQGTGDGTYLGPSTVTADSAVVTEAKAAGDFEAVLSWAVGLRSQVPFRVSTLGGPPRIVIDFLHS